MERNVGHAVGSVQKGTVMGGWPLETQHSVVTGRQVEAAGKKDSETGE